MQCRTLALCALVLAVVPFAPGNAQQNQQTGTVRNCDDGVARRQLMGQPMTDFMAACRANKVNPENLEKICNSAADSLHLSGEGRQTYLKDCMTGPD